MPGQLPLLAGSIRLIMDTEPRASRLRARSRLSDLGVASSASGDTYLTGRARLRAVIYTRVSTKEQSDEGYSLAAQREACSRWIADRGWELVDEYCDAGESARTA